MKIFSIIVTALTIMLYSIAAYSWSQLLGATYTTYIVGALVYASVAFCFYLLVVHSVTKYFLEKNRIFYLEKVYNVVNFERYDQDTCKAYKPITFTRAIIIRESAMYENGVIMKINNRQITVPKAYVLTDFQVKLYRWGFYPIIPNFSLSLKK
jgi:hypothetical protein